ncbi:uncharacterized protein LOC144344186 [Saccoglossus kowalevskii]
MTQATPRWKPPPQYPIHPFGFLELGEPKQSRSDPQIKYEIKQMRHSLRHYIERSRHVQYGPEGIPIPEKLPTINNAWNRMVQFPSERVQSGFRRRGDCCLCQLQRRGQLCGRTGLTPRISYLSRAQSAKEFCEVLGLYSCRDCMREKKRLENEFDYIRTFPPVREINPRTLCAEKKLRASAHATLSQTGSIGKTRRTSTPSTAASPTPSDHSHAGSIARKRYRTEQCVTDNEIHQRLMKSPRRMSMVKVRFKQEIPESPAPSNTPVEWETISPPTTIGY